MKNLRRVAAATALLLTAPALAGCQELTDIGFSAAQSAVKSEKGQAAKSDLSAKGCDWMREQIKPENWDTYQKATGSCAGGTGTGVSGAVVAADPAAVAAASTALASIVIAEESKAAAAQYSGKREGLYGKAWRDLDGDGCDPRNEALIRDTTAVEKDKNGCTVLRGILDDPYTGTTINFAHNKVGGDSMAVQIDHIVPLAEAHRSGADAWTLEQRTIFANDHANLIASDGPANNQKSDKVLARWNVPANPAFRCDYTVQFVNLESSYGLSMDHAEYKAATKALAECA